MTHEEWLSQTTIYLDKIQKNQLIAYAQLQSQLKNGYTLECSMAF